MGRAVGDGGFNVGFPVGKVVGRGAPEHWDVVHRGWDGAVRGGVPVVAPADGGAFEEGSEGRGVVDETAGYNIASAARGGGGGGRWS